MFKTPFKTTFYYSMILYRLTLKQLSRHELSLNFKLISAAFTV